MSKLLIIGYGNRLRGDDAAGYLAAERLQELIQDPEIEILAVHQLTPELMEPVSQAERVTFVDAAVGGEPGTISVRCVDADPKAPAAMSHVATPEGLLSGARTLYGHSPAAVLVSIAGRDFEVGDPLSEPVALALDGLIGSRIRQLRAVRLPIAHQPEQV